MTNIIKACSYVAGIDSSGMQALKAELFELTEAQIEECDVLNANNSLPYWYREKQRPKITTLRG